MIKLFSNFYKILSYYEKIYLIYRNKLSNNIQNSIIPLNFNSINNYQNIEIEKKETERYNMRFPKFIIFLTSIFFIYIVISVSISSINSSINSINDNQFFKIISPSLISNPITLLDLCDYYILKKDIEKAKKYLQYAEYQAINSNVTIEIKERLKNLKRKLNVN